jgi:hypothetical protein
MTGIVGFAEWILVADYGAKTLVFRFFFVTFQASLNLHKTKNPFLYDKKGLSYVGVAGCLTDVLNILFLTTYKTP